ncbi:thymidylate synthase [Azospirillum brasilense]|uniref:IMPACT family protein n=1 Tax=Azospirillum brasilense TaxID=192 RepID=UPI000E680D7E|nr:YigZ family protein [Azospirillum brasilense]NUB11464.1 thymidylate synthase [Azospirillum brasilense]NUB23727.1 thymidylate synthase [Azospirillum brasilense]NUB30351.1 thymidylate synthase [Azospirillum brasilense]RIW08356.1 YigZ family protein [Azospirillum brasilense]
MFTLKRKEQFEQEIKKSRFSASAGPVATEEEARGFIAACSQRDAGHNCWAIRIGDLYRSSDDGEPGGTAGRPILQAIDGQKLDRVALVVSRWFGGVLLGAGGLVRAYGGTAAACLHAAERQPIIRFAALAVTCAFSDEARIRSGLGAFPAASAETNGFTPQGVQLQIKVPCEQLDDVVCMITDASRGQAKVQKSPG